MLSWFYRGQNRHTGILWLPQCHRTEHVAALFCTYKIPIGGGGYEAVKEGSEEGGGSSFYHLPWSLFS